MINQLHIGLSNLCNMQCKHCFAKKSKLHFLSEQKIMQLVSALEKQGLQRVYYTYGEPLMHRDFYKIALNINKLGIYQVLMTNGSLINPNVALKLKECGINEVFISIDSSDEFIHDSNRRTKGAFQKACDSLKLLVKQDIKVSVSTTYFNLNRINLQGIVELVNNLGVDSISFLAIRNNGAVEVPLTADYVKLFKFAVINKKRYMFHDKRLIPIIKELYQNREIDKDTYNLRLDENDCMISNNLSLAPDGNIYNCNFIADIPVTNIHKIIDFESEIKLIKDAPKKGCVFK